MTATDIEPVTDELTAFAPLRPVGHTLEHDGGRYAAVDPDTTRIEIMAVADLHAEIDSATGGLPDDDLSNGEAQRVARLRRLIDNGWARIKRRLLGSPEMVQRLHGVAERCPNFREVTDLVIRAAQLSALTQTPLCLPPLLLLGDPGIGKSHYARSLAEALGSDVTMLAGATLLDSATLTGSNPSWKGARPGKVASALLDGRSCSPVILLDEIDKVHGWSSDRPLDALLGLLEPSDARVFQDDYLGVPLRADGILWICTANDLTPLSAHLRDRFVTLRVPALTRAQRDSIARRIFDRLNADYQDRFALAPAALAVARDLNTRRLRVVLAASFGYAAAARRLTVMDADVAAARALILSDAASTSTPRMGFRFGVDRQG
ncbi:AAA family ATPase [Lichenihabitans sp. Uapishka_5]|uniref:AAA family ATPase n=1 Tax=Lichenihabitans sp. Uapishka_5 TaxID=3037302 RepID=UPI0029E7ED4D|nr:AAA family ATPase [Lichenihabitans sp. Uapishka_5]MDX7952940.1 AAA family ATPase [Lichenihabitans sp. Uapishka_5]